MNFIRRFMQGRYGTDQLTYALIIVALLLNLLFSLLRLNLLGFLPTLLLIIALYRMFSRDLAKRRAENQKFMAKVPSIRNWFTFQMARIRSSKTHKFFRCPGCKNTLRVPRGKGKIYITCPKCGQRFDGKT